MITATDMRINKVGKKAGTYSLTDLHTHILPAIDDGAENVDIAIRILQKLKRYNVERVALTPHFYPSCEPLESFLNRRQRAYEMLLAYWEDKTMPQICLGAEVRYTPELLQMDLSRLTIGSGNYLLLELPDMGGSAYVIQVVKELLIREIVPIFAHIERCLAFRDNPELLFELVQMGALAQIDAGALKEKKRDRFAVKCLHKGLAHVISSDIHNLSDRADSLTEVSSKNNIQILTRAETFSRAIWDGKPLPDFRIKPLKKGVFGYY